MRGEGWGVGGVRGEGWGWGWGVSLTGVSLNVP